MKVLQTGRNRAGFARLALLWHGGQLGLEADAAGAFLCLQRAAQGGTGQAGVDGAGIEPDHADLALPLPSLDLARSGQAASGTRG